MLEQIGISDTAIDKHIKILIEKQIIMRIGGDRKGLWQSINNKKQSMNRKFGMSSQNEIALI